MIRNLILLFLWLLFSFQSSFGQNPAPKKQDPIQDSIDTYTKLRQYDKVVPFAKNWAELCKKINGEESAEYGAALVNEGNALNRTGNSKEAEPLLLQGLEIQKKA
ncbi:MAG TPA: tetratricopeptide repeat protein, partial [Catalimonadaceae bacterium]|nr:tetratricopeptide repeat protein [Catalimonadaceae bacterium]